MVADVELRALAVELGLGAVAQIREPARVLQAGGEHRGNDHGGLLVSWYRSRPFKVGRCLRLATRAGGGRALGRRA